MNEDRARDLYDTPGVASAEQGQVLLDGPDGVAVAMTPEAARVTGERLISAAAEARGQGISAAG